MDRRKFIKNAGLGSGALFVTGCVGNGDGGDGGDGDDSGDGGGDGDGGDGGDGGSDGDGGGDGDGEWPDLDGKRVLLLTEETSEKAVNILSRVTSDFNDATGADAQVEHLGANELNQRLTQLVQAGDPPELVQQPSALTVFYGTDSLAPVNDAVAAFEDRWGELQDNVRIQFDGDDYFAPLWRATSEYWYRDDIVDTHPETWDDLLTAAENADGTDGLAGTYSAHGQSICVDIEVLGWGYSNGARSLEWDGDQVVEALTSTKDRWVEVLEFFQELYQYSPSAADAGCSEQINAVTDGISATGFFPGARPKIQSIRREREYAPDVRAALQPKKESHVTYGDPEGLMTFQGSNTEAAKVFVDFLYQPKYYIDILMITPLHNSPPKAVAESDVMQNRLEEDLSDAWTQEDIDTTIERNDFISNPAIETDPPNSVGRVVFRSQALSQMKFDAVIEEKDPEVAIEDAASTLSDMVLDAQE
jgi:ABC-type glycerol-3-phosphate transport system substrate-binding protein